LRLARDGRRWDWPAELQKDAHYRGRNPGRRRLLLPHCGPSIRNDTERAPRGMWLALRGRPLGSSMVANDDRRFGQ
jgi:hypothetical protein